MKSPNLTEAEEESEKANLSSSTLQAKKYLKRALYLLDKESTKEAAQLKEKCQKRLDEWHAFEAEFGEALKSANQRRDKAKSNGDKVGEARALNDMARLHERLGENRISIKFAEDAEKLVEGVLDGSAEKVRALLLRGWAFYRLGEAELVQDFGNKVLELCTETGDERGMAASLKLIGVANLQLGLYEDADKSFKKGLVLLEGMPVPEEIAAKSSYRAEIAATLSNRGEVARARSDYKKAIEFYEEALVIAKDIRNRDGYLIYEANLCAARLGIGESVQTESRLREVIGRIRPPNSACLSHAHKCLAEALLMQGGRLKEAQNAALNAVRLAQRSQNPLHQGEAWQIMGLIVAKLSMPSSQSSPSELHAIGSIEAKPWFQESEEIFRQMNSPGELARTLRDFATYEFEQRRGEDALKKLLEARDIFVELRVELEVAKTEELLKSVETPELNKRLQEKKRAEEEKTAFLAKPNAKSSFIEPPLEPNGKTLWDKIKDGAKNSRIIVFLLIIAAVGGFLAKIKSDWQTLLPPPQPSYTNSPVPPLPFTNKPPNPVLHLRRDVPPVGNIRSGPNTFYKAVGEGRRIVRIDVRVAHQKTIFVCGFIVYDDIGDHFSVGGDCTSAEKNETFALQAVEHLLKLTGSWGGGMDSVTFQTSQPGRNDLGPFGGSGGTRLYTISAEPGWHIVGFYGKCGEGFDSIGVVEEND